MRSNLIEQFSRITQNNILLSIETKFAYENTIICQKDQADSLIINLEGSINNEAPGKIYCI